MIKPWKDRVEEAAHFREEDYINDVQYFMQAEIDELRSENARLRSALTTARTALIEHGSAYLHHELRYQEALDAARAALGNKS